MARQVRPRRIRAIHFEKTKTRLFKMPAQIPTCRDVGGVVSFLTGSYTFSPTSPPRADSSPVTSEYSLLTVLGFSPLPQQCGIPATEEVRPYSLLKGLYGDEGENMNTDQNDFAGIPEDQTAFRAFYHAAVQHLFPHALRLTRNTEEAKELCQKTIVRAYLRRRTFRPERGTSVFVWLWTVMKNLAATDRVCRTRSGEVTVQFATEHPLVWWEAEQDAESRFIRAERASEVRAALAVLPASFRDTIARHYFDGETCEQIATALCISINTVLTRLFRGRRKLRVLLTTRPDPAPKRGVLFL